MRHHSRPRCDRGHFLPAGTQPGAPCEHEHEREYTGRFWGDLWGQRVTGRQLRAMTTVPLAGSFL